MTSRIGSSYASPLRASSEEISACSDRADVIMAMTVQSLKDWAEQDACGTMSSAEASSTATQMINFAKKSFAFALNREYANTPALHTCVELLVSSGTYRLGSNTALHSDIRVILQGRLDN